jgi:predicted TIM-barrel fold metal-dependent hydrolase
VAFRPQTFAAVADGGRSIQDTDRVCFGSDYPHPEGLDDPLAWRHELDGVPPADVEKIRSTNTFGLLGLTRPRPVATVG